MSFKSISLGEHKLYWGDCLEVMPRLADKSVDMIFADLPYGTTACKWDAIIPFKSLWKQYKRIIKDNGAIILTGSQPFTSALVMSNPDLFKYEWIWEKNRGSNFANVKYMPMKEHENILIFYKNTPTYNEQKIPRSKSGKERSKYEINASNTGKRDVYGKMEGIDSGYIDPNLRCARTIIKFNTEVGLHPTQKPVSLCEYFIKVYTNHGDLVLDNVMGSGTTGEACINLGRKFIGIEKEEKYFEIAYNRLSKVIEEVT